MKKILISLISMFFLIPFVHAEDLNLAPSAKSAILIEPTTGEILYQKEAHVKYAPASMTKIMSMLLIIEAIEKGQFGWNDKVRISSNAASMGGSQIFLEANEVMSVSDLFKGIAVGSANDATVALAEKVGGTEDNFVKLMNKKALSLGLKNTNFKNPTGFDDANHYSTAYDMSVIAKNLIMHNKVLKFTSIYEDYLRKDKPDKYWLVNTNKLVRFYEGVDGLKTGYTEEAGYCLTATAKRNGMRLIAIVFGEPDSKTRSTEVTQMLDYGFNNYSIQNLLSTKNSVGRINIIKGKKEFTETVPKEDVNILYKKGTDMKKVTYKVKIFNNKAPIKKGDIIGKIDIKEDNDIKRSIDVTVPNNIDKAGLFKLYFRYLKDIIKGI